MTYKEQIRSPQWIQFAAKFKEKNGWKCESCGGMQSPKCELTVHHAYYIAGTMMWEHPEELMECLCWPCHKERQTLQSGILQEIASFLVKQKTDGLNFAFLEVDLYLAMVTYNNLKREGLSAQL